MPHERFFLDSPFAPNETLRLQDAEFHHLSRVMRAQIGDQVELVNGKNQLAQANVSHLAKNHADLAILNVVTQEPNKPKIILAQAIPRVHRLETILEKATELDVSEFWLFPGMLSEKEDFSENQQKRMTQIAVAAMKQCGRLDLPAIHCKPPLLKWERIPGCLLFGDTNPTAPQLSKPLVDASPIIFFVGPEKGFDPRETAFLKQTLAARGVRLHRNILRVDTASLVALSLIQ